MTVKTPIRRKSPASPAPATKRKTVVQPKAKKPVAKPPVKRKHYAEQHEPAVKHDYYDDPLGALLSLDLEGKFSGKKMPRVVMKKGKVDTSNLDFDIDLEELRIDLEIAKEIDNASLITRDFRIDDSEIPRAANFYDFCKGEEFLNSPPYLEQALIGVKLLAEYCPCCSDKHWMTDDGHEVTDSLATFEYKVAILEHGECPRCGLTRTELIRDHGLTAYTELAVVAGQRSGKSALVTMIAAYVNHRYLMLPGKPNEMFNIRSNEILHGTFCALTMTQAVDSLWKPFMNYILEAPWYVNYHKFLRRCEREIGESIFKIKDMYVSYQHRNLFWCPAAPDGRTLRGRTRIFASIDELGFFDADRDTKKVKDNARGLYAALSNSLLTARQTLPRLISSGFDQFIPGYMLNVSSPSSIRDMIMELYRQSQGSKMVLGLHKPTWKMNPELPKHHPFFEEAFRKDPVAAALNYGAEPQLSSHPFISNIHAIETCLKPTALNWVRYRYTSELFGVGKEAKRYRSAQILQIKQDNTPRCMAIDAGQTNNSFACTVGSVVDNVISVDYIIEIIPLPGIPVSHTRVYKDVLGPLIRSCGVTVLLADRWQSIKLLEDAMVDFGDQLKLAKCYSLKYHDMMDYKDLLTLGMLKIPRPGEGEYKIRELLEHDPDEYPTCFEYKPIQHFMVQMATVQDASKKQVLKGDGFTDDIFRAAALMTYGLRNPEFAEYFVSTNIHNPSGYRHLTTIKRMASSNPTGVSGSGGSKEAYLRSGKMSCVKKSLRS
jgi:hypothetical protein